MNRDEAQFTRMTETPVGRLIASLAGPTIVSMMITAVYNTADTYFVSLLDDTSATGAVGVVFSLMALIQAGSFTIGMGSGSWISRLLGQRNDAEANTVGSSGILMAMLVGSCVALYGLFCDTAPLMRLLGSTETILPYAKDYAHYIMLAAPFLMSSVTLNKMLCAEGRARFAMIGIATGGVLNILLDPIFIFSLGMKTAGAALATGISQTVSFCILLTPYLRGKTEVKLRLQSASRAFSRYSRIVVNGLPSFTRQGLASVSTILLNTQAAACAGASADAAIAAMSIVSKVFMLAFSVMIGFGQGFQPVLGYNYGARRYDRARRAFWVMLRTCTGTMTVVAVIFYSIAPRMIGIFSSGKTDAVVLAIGTYAFRARCLALPLTPMGVTCNMSFQSTGKPWMATFLSSCRQGLYLLPILLILPPLIGLRGVQIAQPISDLMTFLTCVPAARYFLRDLRRREQEVHE